MGIILKTYHILTTWRSNFMTIKQYARKMKKKLIYLDLCDFYHQYKYCYAIKQNETEITYANTGAESATTR